MSTGPVPTTATPLAAVEATARITACVPLLPVTLTPTVSRVSTPIAPTVSAIVRAIAAIAAVPVRGLSSARL